MKLGELGGRHTQLSVNFSNSWQSNIDPTRSAGEATSLSDMAGNSVLAVFETATGAVSAALMIQNTLKIQTADAAENRRMWHRIGVHIGDVIEKSDGTVCGDGVNIAARLEGPALGHPLADLSYHCMGWHIPPGAFRGIGGLDVTSLGITLEADHIRRNTVGAGP